MKGFYRFLGVITVLTSACNFEPESEVFTKVDPPDTNGLSINLNNFPNQEIVLNETTMFEYSVNTNGKYLIELRVLLNGQTIWTSSTSASGSFVLDPDQLGTGSHTLKIEFVAATGTGSLAEHYGAEVLYVWTQRTILVDRTIPDDPSDPGAVSITSVTNVNNTILVQWSQYPNSNFERYELIREDFLHTGYMGGGVLFGSDLQNEVSYEDHNYVGGKCQYIIKLYAAGKTYTSLPFVYEHPYKPEITRVINGDGSVTIKWNSLEALSANFDGYTLKVRSLIGSFYQTDIYTSSAVMDTSVTFTPPDFKFGSVRDMEFFLDSPRDWLPTVYPTKLRYGDPFPAFIPVYVEPQFNEQTNTFFLARPGNGLMAKVSPSGQLLDSMDVHYPQIVLNNNIGIASAMNDKIYKIDLQNMSAEALPAIPDGSVFDLSENNRLLKFTSAEGTKAFDLQGTVLATIGFSGIDVRYISRDGNWLLAPAIYKWNEVTNQYDLTSGWNSFHHKSVHFMEDEPSTMIVGFDNRVMKMDLETLAQTTSNSYTGPCNIDYTTGLIGCLTGNNFVILNSDFQLQKSLPVTPTAGYFYLLNNTVLCTSGVQVKLSDIP